MLRTRLGALALAMTVSLTTFSCQREPDPPGKAAQDKKDQEGNAWRGLLMSLESAPTDEAKVGLLEKFLTEHPQHPDAADARRRLEALQITPDTEAAKKIAALVQTGLEEGQPQAFVALIGSEIIRQASPRLQRDDLAAPVAVPTSEGVREVSKSLFVHPLVFRGYLRRALQEHAADKLAERCDRKCVDEAVSGIFAGSVGGAVFTEEAKMNPDAVGPLLEKIWVMPDADILGSPARTWFAIFAPTFRAYAKVNAAMKEAKPDDAAAKLATMERKEITAFYRTWAEGAGLAVKTGLDPKDASAVAGWWLRRTADGTAPLFEAFVAKVSEAYDAPTADAE